MIRSKQAGKLKYILKTEMKNPSAKGLEWFHNCETPIKQTTKGKTIEDLRLIRAFSAKWSCIIIGIQWRTSCRTCRETTQMISSFVMRRLRSKTSTQERLTKWAGLQLSLRSLNKDLAFRESRLCVGAVGSKTTIKSDNKAKLRNPYESCVNLNSEEVDSPEKRELSLDSINKMKEDCYKTVRKMYLAKFSKAIKVSLSLLTLRNSRWRFLSRTGCRSKCSSRRKAWPWGRTQLSKRKKGCSWGRSDFKSSTRGKWIIHKN